MQRDSRPEGLDFPVPQYQRSHSMSSDRTPSISGASSLLSPPTVRPDPAYIAASAASQIVSSEFADRDESFDSGRQHFETDSAVVSLPSLILLNGFLDQLLFSFLASSRSTAIAALRPAILEVLKPRLGKEAIDGADEELQGYLAGGDAEELLAFHGGQEFKGEYNLSMVWKRTRLRCMVYTRLGDLEEEDEDIYLQQEHEESGNQGHPRLIRDLGEISPAAAIFLTSIIEFIGEHALLVAAEAAYNRFQTRKPTSGSSHPLVEEVDMEKIAFNTTLGRLWRSWKKRVRTSSLLSPRPMSRELQSNKSSSWSGGDSSRKNSISEDGYFGPPRRPSVAQVLHEDREISADNAPENIALPEEPESEDLCSTNNKKDAFNEVTLAKRDRPRSMLDYLIPREESNVHSFGQGSNAILSTSQDKSDERPVPKHVRSSSLPVKQTPYVSPVDETFTTPSEGPDPFVHESDRTIAEKDMPKLTDDSKRIPGFKHGSHAISTMYDGTISQNENSLPKGIAERTNRGISTYTESSNTDENDEVATPQPSNSIRRNDIGARGIPGSRGSTLSNNSSFHVGEQYPAAQPVGSSEDPLRTGRVNEDDEDAYPSQANPLEQTDAESEPGRQHIRNLATLATLQEQQLRTYNDSGRAVKRDIPVLYDTPSNEDVIYDPDASVRSSAVHEEEEVTTPAQAEQVGMNYRQGAPRFTPPRDTSDEESSHSANQNTPRSAMFVPAHPFQSADGSRIPSHDSSQYSGAGLSTSASKLVDMRAQPSNVNAGTEKAAVQRVSPSASSPLTSNGRRSTSNNRDGRPTTSGSTGSQVSSKYKGIIGRESGDMIRQPLPHRTSSADSGSLINGQLRTPRSADKEMDFEELIRSDETVKYTLTPQNMRQMEAPDSPQWKTHARSDTVGSAQDRPSSAGRLARLKGLNGLRSNPTNGISSSATAQGPAFFDIPKGQSKELPRSPGVVRSPDGASPRVPPNRDDSLRDFADFIRSTGPEALPNTTSKSIASNATKQPRSLSSTSPKIPPKKITKPSPVTTPKGSVSGYQKPESTLPQRTTSKLQAREATVTNNNATADLADFFRSGPAGAQVDRPIQSQRSGVAVRPTGPQDGFLNGRKVNSGSSVASTQESFAPSKMTQSSTNSRTGLLDSTNRAPPVAPAPAQKHIRQISQDEEASSHTRNQRQVRDPYALDSDSEDDGYGTAQPPEREEESLSDFLRNYNPPPTTNARNVPNVQTTAPQPKKQKTTIRERVARNIAVIPDYRPLPPKAPKKNPSKSPPQSNESRRSAKRTNSAGYQPPNQNNVIRGRQANAAPQLPLLDARAGSPHLVSQNGTKMDSYRPTQPTYAKHVDRRPKQQLQAREEHGSLSGPPAGGGMGDLADFLRETEPPPPSGPVGGGRPMSPTKDKEESAFGRMFLRRKKEIR